MGLWREAALPRIRPEPNQTLRVFCGVWNLHGKQAQPEDLGEWVPLDPQHHIYVLGTCECEQTLTKSMVWSSKARWEDQVREHLGEEFFLVGSHTLCAIHVMVFLHRYLWRYCWDIKTGQVATGKGNVMGNKGGVQVGFKLGRTSVLFINAHLAAHEGKMEERTRNFSRILRDSPLRAGRVSGSLVHQEYDRVFFMGDLNSRVVAKRADVDRWLAAVPPQLEQCLEKDELLLLLNRVWEKAGGWERMRAVLGKGEGFDIGEWPHFSEGPITFPPTYKFDANSDQYDTGKKKRVPSWTDRILWKTCHPDIRVLAYSCVPSLKCSDHRPIFGQYEMPVDLDDWEGPALEAERAGKKSAVCTVQ